MSCQTTMHTVCLKEFDTVDIACEYLNDDGTPIDLTNVTVKSSMQLEKPNGGYYQMTVNVTDAVNGLFVVSLGNELLPVGKYRTDILFIDSTTQKRVASDTFVVRVVDGITEPVGV